MESDDEPLTLSASTLAALQEFKQEEEDRIKKFDELYERAEEKFENEKDLSIDDFKEDWQLSQFWYSDRTAEILGRALLEGADDETVIVIASAPSVYAAIKKLPPAEIPTEHIYVLEYDNRFKLLGGSHFAFYDYQKPHDIPEFLRNKCHRLLIDPPFLEPDCQLKSSIAAGNLLVKDKETRTKNGDLKYKLITSTGERMKDVIKEYYPDVSMTSFLPEHKNGLSNEFRCYASFTCPYWNFDAPKSD